LSYNPGSRHQPGRKFAYHCTDSGGQYVEYDGQMNYVRNIATFEGCIGIDDVEVNVQGCRCVLRVRGKTKGAKPGGCIFDTFGADVDTTLPDIGNGYHHERQ